MKATTTTVHPFDAWVLAALRAGKDLDGETDRVSPGYRSFAARLAAAPAEDRERLWGMFLETQADADADDLVDQVARADPESPPPDGEPWGPLRLGELPDVPDFPVDVFPYDVGRLVVQVSAAVGCDPGFVGGPVLATAGGLIGRSAALLLGSNWFAHSNLFVANVGLPGDGKSPTLEYATEPARAIEKHLADLYKKDKEAYLEELREWQQRKGAKKGENGPPPVPPVPARACVDDATLESLFLIMADNPRGLLMPKDELSSLLLGMNQYKGGSGNDRPNLMKVWSGAGVVIDRVRNENREPTRIPFPSVSIVGGLPPAMLVDMVTKRGDDGFLDRWLFVFPDRRKKLRIAERAPVPNDTVARWRAVCRALYGRAMRVGDDGHQEPCVIFMRNEAKAEYDRLFDAHTDEINAPDFPDHLRGPWSKFEVYSGRLCLILALLRHAADPTADPDALPLVEAEQVRDAWRLIDYFKAHHLRVRAYLMGKGLGGAPEGVKTVLRWLRNHPDVEAFPESDLTRDIPPLRKDRAALEDAILWLNQRRAIRRMAEPERPKGTRGRKPAPVWEVHPALRGRETDESNPTADGGEQ